MSTRRRQRPERGSMSVEAVILGPALLLMLGVVIGLGRLGLADNAIDQAVHDAARIASIEQSANTAQTKAYEAAQASLAAQGIACSSLSVTVDPSGFTTPVGVSGNVTVRISCTVSLADQFLPVMPGSKTLTAEASRAIDTYRERA